METEILRVEPPVLMKYMMPVVVVITFLISYFAGDIPTDNLGSVAAVFGVFMVLALLQAWRMSSYHATIYPDRLVVRNLWRRKEFPFEGLTGMGNMVTTSSGSSPIWIRSFDMIYGSETKKVRIAGLGYQNGMKVIETMNNYFKQLAAASQGQQNQ